MIGKLKKYEYFERINDINSFEEKEQRKLIRHGIHYYPNEILCLEDNSIDKFINYMREKKSDTEVKNYLENTFSDYCKNIYLIFKENKNIKNPEIDMNLVLGDMFELQSDLLPDTVVKEVRKWFSECTNLQQDEIECRLACYGYYDMQNNFKYLYENHLKKFISKVCSSGFENMSMDEIYNIPNDESFIQQYRFSYGPNSLNYNNEGKIKTEIYRNYENNLFSLLGAIMRELNTYTGVEIRKKLKPDIIDLYTKINNIKFDNEFYLVKQKDLQKDANKRELFDYIKSINKI